MPCGAAVTRLEMPESDARKQKLFEAARAMCEGFTTKEFIRVLRAAKYLSDDVYLRLTEFGNLNKAVNACEGVAFSDGGEE